MPQAQVAQGSFYDFGAPAASGQVLKFKVRPNAGGVLDFTFEAPDADADVTVSVQTAETTAGDPGDFAATTSGKHGAAITSEVIKPRTNRTFRIVLRPGVDKWVRVLASGSDRCGVRIGGNEKLEMMTA